MNEPIINNKKRRRNNKKYKKKRIKKQRINQAKEKREATAEPTSKEHVPTSTAITIESITINNQIMQQQMKVMHLEKQ